MGIFDTPESSPAETGNEPTGAEVQDQQDVAEPTEAAPDEGQPAEDGETGATAGLLAGKYPDAKALEKAYLEAQKELGRLRNEIGALRAAQAPALIPGLGNPAPGQMLPQQMSQLPQQPQAPQVDWQKAEETFFEQWNKNPLLTTLQLAHAIAEQQTAPLRQEVQRMRDEAAVARLLSQREDLRPLEPAARKIMDAIPALRAYGEAGWQMAFAMARGQYADAAMAQAREAGASEAEAAVAAKLTGGAVAGGAKRQEQKPPSYADEVIRGVREAWKERGGGIFG